jgi:hypothetical protein
MAGHTDDYHAIPYWEEQAPVSYAYSTSGVRQRELYKVVPLRVHPG